METIRQTHDNSHECEVVGDIWLQWTLVWDTALEVVEHDTAPETDIRDAHGEPADEAGDGAYVRQPLEHICGCRLDVQVGQTGDERADDDRVVGHTISVDLGEELWRISLARKR